MVCITTVRGDNRTYTTRAAAPQSCRRLYRQQQVERQRCFIDGRSPLAVPPTVYTFVSVAAEYDKLFERCLRGQRNGQLARRGSSVDTRIVWVVVVVCVVPG